MNTNYFNDIVHEIAALQQRMTVLKAENASLREELAALRNGRGLLLTIGGQVFSLAGEQLQVAPTTALEPEPRAKAVPTAQLPPLEETKQHEELGEEMVVIGSETEGQQEPEKELEHEQQEHKEHAPTFLEEIMLDEFAAAATNPLAVWNGPIKQPEPIGEEQKAALRRELMGSFLLE